jgi:nucleoside-diphosphate-sugar epimerase
MQQRDYIHVDDVISFINLCIQQKPSGIYNICSGELLSVNDIFHYIADEYNFTKPAKYKDASMLWDTYPDLFEGRYSLNKTVVSKETNKYSRGSFQKAFKELGWKPNTDLKTLIKKVSREIKI